MSLTEGKNREVRRVLAHLGLQVSRLIRTAYGPFTLEGLEPGDVDEVDRRASGAFRKTLQVRIIAGHWRGRPIEAPPGQATRPTADRVARNPVLDARQPARLVRGSARRRPVRRQRRARVSKPCRAAQRRATFVETRRRRPRRSSGATPRSSAHRSHAHLRRLGAGASALRAVRPDLRRPALCEQAPAQRRRQAVAKADWLAPGGWMSVETSRGDEVDPGSFDDRDRSATSAARGLRFCAGLSRLRRLLISSISVLSRRPIAAAAALPAAFTALPARLPRRRRRRRSRSPALPVQRAPPSPRPRPAPRPAGSAAA